MKIRQLTRVYISTINVTVSGKSSAATVKEKQSRTCRILWVNPREYIHLNASNGEEVSKQKLQRGVSPRANHGRTLKCKMASTLTVRKELRKRAIASHTSDPGFSRMASNHLAHPSTHSDSKIASSPREVPGQKSLEPVHAVSFTWPLTRR